MRVVVRQGFYCINIDGAAIERVSHVKVIGAVARERFFNRVVKRGV